MSLRDDLKAKSQRALAGMGATTPVPAKDSRPVTTPGAVAFLQPTIDALNERVKKAESENEELRQKLNGQPTEVALELLDRVASRKRKLTHGQFEELKENLRLNPLVHPVAVKALSNGRYEIVSGHNRVDAFEALGRPTVPVVVIDIADTMIDRAAFYANLLQPSLPDFEKYLGFKREQQKTSATQKDMARAAGIPESTVSMLMAFDHLPERARELIEERPDAVGMNCVFELARLTKAGATERVTQAVELLLDGKLSQKEAVLLASQRTSRLATAVIPPAAPPVKIRAGRLEFCQYVARGSSLRIDFKAEEDRADAERRIAELLQQLADAARGNS